jgi:hypothetical protein
MKQKTHMTNVLATVLLVVIVVCVVTGVIMLVT